VGAKENKREKEKESQDINAQSSFSSAVNGRMAGSVVQ
jgi:hypothetical protein